MLLLLLLLVNASLCRAAATALPSNFNTTNTEDSCAVLDDSGHALSYPPNVGNHSNTRAVWKDHLASRLDDDWQRRVDNINNDDPDQDDLLHDFFTDALGSAYSRWRSLRSDGCVIMVTPDKVARMRRAYDKEEDRVERAAYELDRAVLPRERCHVEAREAHNLGVEFRDTITSCKWSAEPLAGLAYPNSPHQLRMMVRAVRANPRVFKGVSVVAGGHGAECSTAMEGVLLISLEKLKFLQLTSEQIWLGGQSVFANDELNGRNLMGLGYENWRRYACINSVAKADSIVERLKKRHDDGDDSEDHVWDHQGHLDLEESAVDIVEGGMAAATKGMCGEATMRTGWSEQLYENTNLVVVGGGVEWGEAYFEMVARGYLLHGGSCYSVGVSGYTLGGGLGLLTRSMGYGVDQVEGIEYVNAQGAAKLITADAVRRSSLNSPIRDMWWGMLGGGRTMLGLVTKWVLKVTPRAKAGCTYLADLRGLFVNDRDKMLEAARAYACWVNNVDEVLGEEDRNKFTFRFAIRSTTCAANALNTTKTPWEYPIGVRYQMMWNDMATLKEESIPLDRDPKKMLETSTFLEKGTKLLGMCKLPIPGTNNKNDAESWKKYLLEEVSVNCVGADWKPGMHVELDQLTDTEGKIQSGKAKGFLGNYALTAWMSQPWNPSNKGNTMHSMYLYTFSDRFAEELVYSFVDRPSSRSMPDNNDHRHYPRTYRDLYDPSIYGCLSGTKEHKKTFMGKHSRYVDTTHVGGAGEHVSPQRPPVMFDVHRAAKNIIFFDYDYPLRHDEEFQAVASVDVVRTVLSNQNALKVAAAIHTEDLVKIQETGEPGGPLSSVQTGLRSYVLLDDSRFAVCWGCSSNDNRSGQESVYVDADYNITPSWDKWTIASCPSYIRYYGNESALRLQKIKMREDPKQFFPLKQQNILRMINKSPWVKKASKLEKLCADQHSWLNQHDKARN